MGNWQKLSEETLLKKFGKEMRKAVFLDPAGQEVDFVLFGQKDWVATLPITADGQVIVVE